MRTTITLADDVSAAVERVRRERGVGPSEAVNALIRQGLAGGERPQPFQQRVESMGMRLDVADVGHLLDLLDEPRAAS